MATEFTPAERAAMAQLAREDFYTFARWMFIRRKGFKWLHSPHHALICDALNRVYRGECKRLIINIPPRYSKTELAVVNWIAWCMGRHPDAEFIHASYSAALAINNSRNCRDLTQHEAFSEIFPEFSLFSDAGHDWRTTQGGVMYATGAEGTITGFGAGKHRAEFGGAIVLDDVHKASEASSDVMRKNIIDWFQNTVESRKNDPKNTPIIVIGQRLHEEDLPGWLINGGNGEKWELLTLPAICEAANDPLGREIGDVLWTEKHDLAMLKAMQEAAPYTFAGQYQQTPVPLGNGIFRPEMIDVVDAMPAGVVKQCRGWDLASTVDGDYTAGVLLGRLGDGRYIICDALRLRDGPDVRDAAIKSTASRDGRRAIVGLPQDPGQAGKTQIAYLTRALAGFVVKSSPESGDKVTRAEPMAAQVNVGNVLMLRGAWNDALINEMRSFPFGKFDDQVDAMSRAFSEVMVNNTVGIFT